MTFRHILVATDFGESARYALDVGVELAQTFGAQLTLAHSWEVAFYAYAGPPYIPGELAGPIQQAATAQLERAMRDLQQRLARATSLLSCGSPWSEILAAAERVHADLIVTGTHGRRALSRALLGSVAEKVVRMATVPVLTVHARQPVA
jgi:nucleotide-binding universal stress UspA family protein